MMTCKKSVIQEMLVFHTYSIKADRTKRQFIVGYLKGKWEIFTTFVSDDTRVNLEHVFEQINIIKNIISNRVFDNAHTKNINKSKLTRNDDFQQV